jgi:hypothetical protein
LPRCAPAKSRTTGAPSPQRQLPGVEVAEHHCVGQAAVSQHLPPPLQASGGAQFPGAQRGADRAIEQVTDGCARISGRRSGMACGGWPIEVERIRTSWTDRAAYLSRCVLPSRRPNLPDNVTAAGVALLVAASGKVDIKTTVLLTPEEVDAAVKVTGDYRPPGG